MVRLVRHHIDAPIEGDKEPKALFREDHRTQFSADSCNASVARADGPRSAVPGRLRQSVDARLEKSHDADASKRDSVARSPPPLPRFAP